MEFDYTLEDCNNLLTDIRNKIESNEFENTYYADGSKYKFDITDNGVYFYKRGAYKTSTRQEAFAKEVGFGIEGNLDIFSPDAKIRVFTIIYILSKTVFSDKEKAPFGFVNDLKELDIMSESEYLAKKNEKNDDILSIIPKKAQDEPKEKKLSKAEREALRKQKQFEKNQKKRDRDAAKKEQFESLNPTGVTNYMPEETDIDISLDANEFAEIISHNKVDEVKKLRKVYLSPRFRSLMESLKNRNKQVWEELNQDLTSFSVSNDKELDIFLKQRTIKKFKAVKFPMYKIYVNGTSGNRLIITFGHALKDNPLYDDSILVLGFVLEHDRQTDEARKIDEDILNKLTEYVINVNEGKETPMYEYVKTPVFKFRFQLSDDQKKIARVGTPALIKGNAGAGKTVISFDLYEKLKKNDYNVYYITFNDYLVRYARDYLPSDLITDLSHLTTTSGFMMNLLKKQPDKFIDFNGFKKWLHNDFNIKKNKIDEIPSYILWTFIRGVIKGRYINSNIEYMTLEEFDLYIKSNEAKYINDIDKIYECFKLYQKHLRKNKYFDDNDLATLLIKSERVEDIYIVLDEVQDLTDRILHSISHFASNNHIYMLGDPNQTIQPTIIDLDAIEMMFRDNCDNYSKLTLPGTFRNGKEILKFINYLNEMRIRFIGRSNLEDDIRFESNRSDSNDLCAIRCCGNKKLNHEIIDMVSKSANTVILVPSPEIRDEIVRYSADMETRCFTIEDIKGLEQDNIIIYNFFMDNEKYIKDIVNGNGKRDTFSRTMFNRLYVAATRARNRIAILEDTYDPLMDEFYFGIVKKNSIEEVKPYFDLDVSEEAWEEAAIQFKNQMQFSSAINAYRRINKDDKYSESIELCERLDNANTIVHDSSRSLTDRYNQLEVMANYFIDKDEFMFLYDSLNYLVENGYEKTDLYYYIKLNVDKVWSDEDLKGIDSLKSYKYFMLDINLLNEYCIKRLLNQQDQIIKELEAIVE